MNGIAPGFVDGRWLRSAVGDGNEAVRDATAQRAPLRAVATPEARAEAIYSLIRHGVHAHRPDVRG